MWKRYALLLCSLPIWMGLPSAAFAAESCRLVRIVSLDVETQPDGLIAIPARAAGRDVSMLVDTGSITSSLNSATARDLGLTIHQLGRDAADFPNGFAITAYVRLDSFNLGGLEGQKMPFSLLPDGMQGAELSGMIGDDILRAYDVEIDFAGGKLNLYSQDHCPGRTVYWTRDAYASVPMKLDEDSHIVVPALLDGKPVIVMFDTGSYRSSMTVEAAHDIFGWDEKNPPYKSLPAVRINGGAPVPQYQYPFATLSFDGIAVYRPDIVLMPKKRFDPHGSNDTHIVLGMNVLRQLHIYAAYKEQMLYLTAAEAH